jgi:hypothetical protein
LRDVVDFLARAPAAQATLNKALFVCCKNEFNEDAHEFHEDTGRKIFNKYRSSACFLYVASQEFMHLIKNPFERSFAQDIRQIAGDQKLLTEFIGQTKMLQSRLSLQMARHMRPDARNLTQRLHAPAKRQSVQDFFGFPHIPAGVDPVPASFPPLSPQINSMLTRYRANARR